MKVTYCLGKCSSLSVEVEAEVQSVKMTEDILRDVPDAVLSHLGNNNNAIIVNNNNNNNNLGKHSVPQLSAAQRSGPGHTVTGECAQNNTGDHSLET